MSVPEIRKVSEIKRRGQNSLQCVSLQTRKPRELKFCCRCCLRKGFMCFPPGHSPSLENSSERTNSADTRNLNLFHLLIPDTFL